MTDHPLDTPIDTARETLRRMTHKQPTDHKTRADLKALASQLTQLSGALRELADYHAAAPEDSLTAIEISHHLQRYIHLIGHAHDSQTTLEAVRTMHCHTHNAAARFLAQLANRR